MRKIYYGKNIQQTGEDKLEKWKIDKTDGYLTVETALLMGLILPMLFLLILTGFYVHDRAYVQGIACEGSALAGAMHWIPEGETKAEAIIAERDAEGLLWGSGKTASVEISKKLCRWNVTGSAGGSFAVLAFRPFVEAKTLSMDTSWKKTVYETADLIRVVRGAQALITSLEK